MPMPKVGSVQSDADDKKDPYDCAECPSYIKPAEAKALYGRDIGVPLCARRGLVLGNKSWSGERNTNLRISFGTDCPEAAKPRPPVEDLPGVPMGRVVEENMQALAGGRLPPEDLPTTCMSCKWLVGAQIVRSKFGWSQPICSAQGRLLWENRLEKEAQACTTNFGIGRKSGVTNPGGAALQNLGDLIPIYREGYRSPNLKTPVDAWKEAQAYDPDLYETDLPLSDEDVQAGIRAWVEVTDPDGFGKPIHYPIFEDHAIPEGRRALIPRTGDEEHPEGYIDSQGLVYSAVATWMGMDYTPNLIGEAGCGKTELFRHLAWRMRGPLTRINITNTTENDSLAGKWLFEEGATVWVNGRLADAFENIGVVCIDEWNCGPPEVDQLLRPLTDNSKQFVLDEAKGQRLTRNEFCFLGLTGNPPWDPKYIGVNEINDASGTRVTTISVDLPVAEVERTIIKNACKVGGYDISDEHVDVLMAIATEVRASIAQGLPISWGLRSQIMVARQLEYFNIEKAYNHAVGNRLEPGTREQIMLIVRRCAPESMMAQSAEDPEVVF